jgi:hypothetical protein
VGEKTAPSVESKGPGAPGPFEGEAVFSGSGRLLLDPHAVEAAVDEEERDREEGGGNSGRL